MPPRPDPLSALLSSPRYQSQFTHGRAGLIGLPWPANDNAQGRMARPPAPSPETLRAALRLFAGYGLAAADEARRRAECATRDGDEAGFAHWHTICRALDRRLARTLDAGEASAG